MSKKHCVSLIKIVLITGNRKLVEIVIIFVCNFKIFFFNIFGKTNYFFYTILKLCLIPKIFKIDFSNKNVNFEKGTCRKLSLIKLGHQQASISW